ncbi:hydroxymethylglutaryl-CoA lyase [Limimaricola cinnabarinus]|uniref:Hydroxymethylglutaryl-CoA lyase n=1 Tax=Limimaricola cinnabarinus LL-001 TaxID=1337093 RepID=U2YZK3_9RHOB|nr:hydroxymethylglutaryl-CoA lyase [Limimaricola cinnabarinus]GAD54520.1 hydroxymethylglutaryl-CoA lyase [Limimaricola cinnabarinus LL-001]
MAERVEIVEVGPRDGLQNEARIIPTADKIALVDRLSACGFARIEVTSFVNPKRVPQMADAAQVLAAIARAPAIRYAALAPNLRGFEAAREAGAGEVAVFASASEGFSRANIGCSIAESMERFAPIMEAAEAAGLPVRGYVSCVTHCPYDGKVAPEAVADVAMWLLDMGCFEISLGETLGQALPKDTGAMLDAVLARAPAEKLAGHFHDTSGRALDNVGVCLDRGLRVFDASIGGLGGCPFAPGAAGNVATEALALMLAERGFETGLDHRRIAQAAAYARGLGA